MALFSDGHVGSTMETQSDFSAWTGTAGTPTIVGTPHHGANAMLINAVEYAYADFAGSDPVFGRCYVIFNALPAVGETVTFIGLKTQSVWCEARVYNDGGTVKWRMIEESGTYTYGSGPSLSTWYHVEVKHIRGGDETCRMYVEGTEILAGGRGTLNGSNSIYIGNYGNALNSLNIDCIVADTSYVGTEPVLRRMLIGVGR